MGQFSSIKKTQNRVTRRNPPVHWTNEQVSHLVTCEYLVRLTLAHHRYSVGILTFQIWILASLRFAITDGLLYR